MMTFVFTLEFFLGFFGGFVFAVALSFRHWGFGDMRKSCAYLEGYATEIMRQRSCKCNRHGY